MIDLTSRIDDLREMEARSGSMDPALITPEYVYRMWGGKVLLENSSISKITYLCNKIYHADN